MRVSEIIDHARTRIAMTPESASAPRHARFLVLAGAVIVQLLLGTIYGYSIFWEPLSSEVFPELVTAAEAAGLPAEAIAEGKIRVMADEAAVTAERAARQSYLKYAFSICVLSFAAVMVFAGRVQDLKGPRFPALVGAVLMGGGFIVAGLLSSPIVFFIAHSLFAGVLTLVALMGFHALYGHLDPNERAMARYAPQAIMVAIIVGAVVLGNQYVGRIGEMDSMFLLWGTVGFLAGAGVGFAYVSPIAALVKWFPANKGLVSGVAVAGFGLGALLFSQKWGALGFITEFGITRFFVVHGLVCLVGISLGALLLRNPPGHEPGRAAASGDAWRATLRQPAFYVLWAMYFSASVAGLGVIGIVKVFAGEQLVDAARAAGELLTEESASALMLGAAKAVGVLALFNALGRVVWGFVSDRIGRTPAFVAMFLLQAATMFALGGMRTETGLVIAASLVGFNYGGAFALFPSATADLFGARNLGANYGWLFTSYGIAGVVGIAAGNAAKTMTGSYAAAFAMAGTLCLVSAALAFVLKRMAGGMKHSPG
jgi:MFS transporter, OFA family, oxalate/formate antiporter